MTTFEKNLFKIHHIGLGLVGINLVLLFNSREASEKFSLKNLNIMITFENY